MGERHAEGHARLRAREPDRCRRPSTAATAYVAVKRPLLDDYVAVHLPHARLRQDVDEDRRPASRRRLRALGARGSDAQGAALRRHASTASTSRTTTATTGSRCALNLPDIAVSDHLAGRQRPRDRHARPRLLHPRPHRAAAAVRRAAVARPPTRISSRRRRRSGRPTAPSITYWLKQPAQAGDASTSSTRTGHVIRTYKDPTPTKADAADAEDGARGRGGFGGGDRPRPQGVNHFTVGPALRAGHELPDGMILWGASTQGPAARPGRYTVRLDADGRTQNQPVTVKRNPLFTDVSDADLQAQFALAIRIRDKLSTRPTRRVIECATSSSRSPTGSRSPTTPRSSSSAISSPPTPAAVERNIYQVQQPERAGSAQLPDQDQQPHRHAAQRVESGRRAADRATPSRSSTT